MEKNHRILIVEDETIICQALARLLERNGYRVEKAETVHEAETRDDLDQFNLIISDLRLPDGLGTRLIELAGSAPVLIMTSYASLRSAVEAMKMGAVDYISKPFDHQEMLETVARLVSPRTPARSSTSAPTNIEMEDQPGSCDAICRLRAEILKVAQTEYPVLICGETGTGKGMVARAIHNASDRATAPFVSFNCASIPSPLIEAKLFGNGENSESLRPGLVEEANGGTLFLNDVDELPREIQAHLLEVLQEGKAHRPGADPIQVEARLLFATHQNLKAMTEHGDFRDDLYYRINVITLHLPTLRSRADDIPVLCEHFLAKHCRELNKPSMQLSKRAIRAVAAHSWPGNIRELENALRRAVILAEKATIDEELLDIAIPQPQSTDAEPDPGTTLEAGENLSLEEYFTRFVLDHQEQMSETELANKLGISRKCLWERRQRFGIPRTRGTARRAKKPLPAHQRAG